MKNKKIFITFLLFPFLCNCFGQSVFSFKKFENDSYALSWKSNAYSSYKIGVTKESVEKKKENITNALANKSSANTFIRAYNQLTSDYSKVLNALYMSETAYYDEPTSESKATYEFYHSLYLSTLQFMLDIETEIAKSSRDIKRAYFGNLSDEEIENRLKRNTEESAASEYSKDILDIQNYMNEASSDYSNGRMSAKEYFDLSVDKYFELIQISNTIRDIYKKDTYLDYLYESTYSRDYKPSDSLKFIEYTKKYFLPIYEAESSLAIPSDVDEYFVDALEYLNFCNSTTKAYLLYENFAKDMGSSYLNKYNYFWRNGAYCFSGSTNSLGTAYIQNLYDESFGTKNYLAFFSRDYQSILSIIHEFGHYYGLTANSNNNSAAYDILETHSQGDEYTFLNYLVTNYTDDPHYKDYCYFADSKSYNELVYLINQSAIAEIENYAYSQENLTKEGLKSKINEILDSYHGKASSTYWPAGCILSPGYYISYGISLIESMQFYSMSYVDAKNAYNNFCKNGPASSTILTWTNCGLKSPFDESTFLELSTLFSEISQKY